MKTILITGATGFLGRELARVLLASDPTLSLLALVRAPDDVVLEERRRKIVAGLPAADAARLQAVRGDATAPHLGLSAVLYRAVLERVDRAIHCAASTRFDLSLADARLQNVESTRSVLALCRAVRARGGEGRLDHVSTAFVAGKRTGVVREDELLEPRGFRNTYERTKFEAEDLCRRAAGDVPIAIHRPSIVIGRQSSGATTSYKTVYGPLRVMIGLYDRWPAVLPRVLPVPLPPDVAVDVVPVDWVAGAIATLARSDDAVGRTFHLAAGVEQAPTVREIADCTCDFFGSPHLGFVTPGTGLKQLGTLARVLLGRTAPRIVPALDVMFAYGLGMPAFDTTNLGAAGLCAPRPLDYFKRILSFAVGTGFGRARTAGDQAPGIAAAKGCEATTT